MPHAGTGEPGRPHGAVDKNGFMGDPLSEFSGGQRIGLIMASALAQFVIDMHDLRRLLELAVREDTNRRRPAELDERAGNLGMNLAQRVERAVIRAFEALRDQAWGASPDSSSWTSIPLNA